MSISRGCSVELIPGTLVERPTIGPDIMALLLLLLYSKPGRIMDPTGLALERGIPQSPEPPIGDLWGTMPLFIGPDNTHTHTHIDNMSTRGVRKCIGNTEVTSPHTHVSRVTIGATHHVLLFNEHGASTGSSRPTWRLSFHGHGPLEGSERRWTDSRTPWTNNGIKVVRRTLQ